jgi:hypothetical protein
MSLGEVRRRWNRDSGHASAQAPQKVHSPLAKSMLGKPPVDGAIIFSGQADRRTVIHEAVSGEPRQSHMDGFATGSDRQKSTPG